MIAESNGNYSFTIHEQTSTDWWCFDQFRF